jgi:Ca2+-binding RTX toxin-like protein
MATKPNDQNGMLSGNEHGTNDTLTTPLHSGAPPPLEFFFGDANMMNDSSRGGNDVLIGVDGANERKVACGDAFMMEDSSRGGNDLIIGGTGGSGNQLLCGDACTMSDNARGGNDLIIGGSGATNILIGDACAMSDNVRGGNDVLVAGNGGGINIMFGDASGFGGLVAMSGNAVGGNDTLISGNAVDNMWGDGQMISGTGVTTGADTFVFAPDSNADTINDFRQTDHDQIDVSAYGFAGIADLDINVGGGNTLIDFGGGNSVTLVGFTGALTGSDFMF